MDKVGLGLPVGSSVSVHWSRVVVVGIVFGVVVIPVGSGNVDNS